MSFLPLHAIRKHVADENVELWVVGTDEAGARFDEVAPMLSAAVKMNLGRLTLEDVRERIATGWMHLFIVSERPTRRLLAACVTEFVVHPRGKALNIALIGGIEAHRWIDRLFEIERWAENEGCRWIELSGRRGWEKVLGRLHYKPIHTTLAKELQ